MRKPKVVKPFYFRNFKIYQDKCAMKVGTDGMLLGALTHIINTKKILDIGTGSGLIALMLAQKTKAIIHAVEIDKNAFEQATENVNNSVWKNRISVFHTAIQDFNAYIDSAENAYDLIISNPPFFEETSSVRSKAKTLERATARDHGSLNFADLCFHAARLLKRGGVFQLILPFDKTEYFIELAKQNGLQLLENISVRSKASKDFHRSIMAFKKDETPETVNHYIFTIYQENGLYTEQYLLATQPYHAANVSSR